MHTDLLMGVSLLLFEARGPDFFLRGKDGSVNDENGAFQR